MSKRLASFQGPSTPSSSPVKHKPSVPPSPSRAVETTYHRKIRTLLQEVRSILRIWDELVKIDGLRLITTLTDTRTDLSNTLRSLSGDNQPRIRLVGPRLDIMEKCISDLDTLVSKLKKLFTKLNSVMESLDEIFCEAHRLKGWSWVHEEPLWCTWTLENFVTTMPNLLPPYHRSLHLHIELVETLKSHSLPFEESRRIITTWMGQPHLEASDWVAEWEDLCEVEVERWNTK